jgi:hypothetical protein
MAFQRAFDAEDEAFAQLAAHGAHRGGVGQMQTIRLQRGA